jgi:hypothetical protein
MHLPVHNRRCSAVGRSGRARLLAGDLGVWMATRRAFTHACRPPSAPSRLAQSLSPAASRAVPGARSRRSASVTLRPRSHPAVRHVRVGMVYAPWRSRLEGTIGTLSDHHGLRGGRHGFRVRGRRGRTKVALLAICAAVAFDLTRQGDFLSDHGTGDDPTTTPPRPRLAARSTHPPTKSSRCGAASNTAASSAPTSTRRPAPAPTTPRWTAPTHLPPDPVTRPRAVG